jgi:CRP-like cAMP-binding protein
MNSERRGLRGADLWLEGYGAALRRLHDDDLQAVAEAAMRRVYGKGRTIAEPRHGQGGIFAVESGAVVLFECIGEKRIPLCHRRRRGDIFALGRPDALATGHAVAQAARDDTVLYSVSWTDVLELAASRPPIGAALATVERELELNAESFAVELATCDTLARVMHAVCLLAGEHPDRTVRETREEIAREAVTSRKEVTKGLRVLLRQGLARKQRGHRAVAVPDLDALEAAYERRRQM